MHLSTLARHRERMEPNDLKNQESTIIDPFSFWPEQSKQLIVQKLHNSQLRLCNEGNRK